MRMVARGRAQAAALLAAIGVLALGHGVGEAHGEPGIVVVGGSADDHARSTVAAAIESRVKEAGWSLAGSRLTAQEVAGLIACKDAQPVGCVPASLAAAGVRRVVAVTVDPAAGDDGSPEFVLVGRLIVTSPPASSSNKRHCDHCADDRLAQESTVLVEGMLRELASQSGRTVIDIRSDPPGAAIVLDGNRIGVTNATFNTFPGTHVVALEKPGYEAASREVVVEEGMTARVALTLRPSSARTEIRRPRRSRLVPGLVLGGGLAAVAGGVLLYVVDEDPSPTGGKKYWDTAPAGIAVGIGGVALAGVGSFLLWRAGRADASTPTASVVPGGAVVGWARRF
jgi:hypothetical protein